MLKYVFNINLICFQLVYTDNNNLKKNSRTMSLFLKRIKYREKKL